MAKSSTAANVIATRYATALIDTAVSATGQASAIESVEKDMSSLATMLAASEDLRSLISSPLFRCEQQQAAISAIAEKGGFNKLTINFLNVLAQNRRLGALAQIISAFTDALAARRGEVKADVTTAFALTPEQERALQDSLKKSLGFNVHLNLSVDRSLLGGMVLTVGSRMVDDSVKGKLARLKQAMQASNQNITVKDAV